MEKIILAVGILFGCAASIAAQSVSVNFGSYPAGTSVGALNVPNVDFFAQQGSSAQIDDRSGVGSALVYTQQVAIGSLPRPTHFTEPAGLVMVFHDTGVTPQHLMRMSSISFDWAVKGRSVQGPVCIIDQVALVTDGGIATSVQLPTHYNGTQCPPPGAPGWSGSYYAGHYEFRDRAFAMAGLVFPFTAAGSPGLDDTELLIFNIQATAAPPCILGTTGDIGVTGSFVGGGTVLLTWTPSSGLNLNDGSYVVETSRNNSFSPLEYQKGTKDTSLSIPIKASDTDYQLFLRVWAFEVCYPGWGIGGTDQGGYVYSPYKPRVFTVKAGGVVATPTPTPTPSALPTRPAIQRVPTRPPVRNVAPDN